jgi:hypothetical protein
MHGKLVSFFLWLVNESIRSNYNSEMRGGHACKGIIEDIMLCGLEQFTNRIMEGRGTEYRLNSAGLKLYIDINKPLNRVRVRIGGDQVGDYPMFAESVKAEITRRGLDGDSYYAKGISSWRNIN